MFFAELFLVVDIDLGERDGIGTGELGGQLFINGRNSFTRSAPIGIN